MVRMAKQAFTPEFLAGVVGGLFVIYDEVNRTTHLGWIKMTEVQNDDGFVVMLGETVVKEFGKDDWGQLSEYKHSIKPGGLVNYTALPMAGNGFHCSDMTLQEPFLKIIPSAAIPPEYKRDHAKLIEYGRSFRD